MSSFNMHSDFRTNHFKPNTDALISLCVKLGVSMTTTTQVTKPTQTSTPEIGTDRLGCFPIAIICIFVGILIGGMIDGFNGGGLIFFGGFIGFIIAQIIIGSRGGN